MIPHVLFYPQLFRNRHCTGVLLLKNQKSFWSSCMKYPSDRHLYLLLAAFLGSCSGNADQQSENDVALLRESLPGIKEECVEIFRKKGLIGVPSDVRTCFPMEKQKRWTGLWRDEFEGSTFCPSPANRCEVSYEDGHLWLHFAKEELKPEWLDRYGSGDLYEIEFVGRRTAVVGAFGHAGLSDSEIVVEKLIRLKKIPE